MAALGCHATAQTLQASVAEPSAPVAGAAQDFWGLTLPNWIATGSLSFKEGYDTNVFGVTTNLAGHSNIADVASAYTTVSAGITFNLLAGAPPQAGAFVKALTLAYQADYTHYQNASGEDNLRNTFTLDSTGKGGAWSYSFDNPLLYVDGSKEDEFFSYYNNLGYGAVRERRNQIQERNNSFLRYDFSEGFIRLVDSASYYNLLIDEHNPVGAYKGYANWVNRDDINAGLDLGYDLSPGFSLVGGWRLGQQTQAHTSYSLVSSDNTYNRALLGFEGSLQKWLQAQLLAGPDFRRYSDQAHPGLIGPRHTWLFVQGQLTATLSPNDTLTASEKVWHFVSSAGVSSIQETSETVSYQHKFSPKLSASAGVRILGHRYDAPTVRNDWTTSVPLNVTYAIDKGVSLAADYSATSGHTHYPVSVSPGQNFEDNVASISLKISY